MQGKDDISGRNVTSKTVLTRVSTNRPRSSMSQTRTSRNHPHPREVGTTLSPKQAKDMQHALRRRMGRNMTHAKPHPYALAFRVTRQAPRSARIERSHRGQLSTHSVVFFDSIFRLTLGLACIGFTLSPSLSSQKAHLILFLRRTLSMRQCRSTPRELQAPTRPQHSPIRLDPRHWLVLHPWIPYSMLFRCRTSSAYPTVCSLWMSKERHSSGRPRCTTSRHEGHVCSYVRQAKVLAEAIRLLPGGEGTKR